MRIIHDVDGPMQVTAGLTPLRGAGDDRSAARVELLACIDPNYSMFRDDDSETIYIEGDAAAVVRMLEEWIHCISWRSRSSFKKRSADDHLG